MDRATLNFEFLKMIMPKINSIYQMYANEYKSILWNRYIEMLAAYIQDSLHFSRKYTFESLTVIYNCKRTFLVKLGLPVFFSVESTKKE